MSGVDLLLVTVVALVALALVFDFTNGFHDAANSVATVVATRALPARWAPAFSAFFNFAAYFLIGTAVANTVAKTVKPQYGGRAVWCSRRCSPRSRGTTSRGTWACPPRPATRSSGDSSVRAWPPGGVAAISWDAVSKAVIGIVASPAVAFSIALVAMFLVAGVQRMFRLRDEHPVFKGLQLVSAGAVSFGHGANDAQKTMGVIAALLLATGHTHISGDGTTVEVPEWVALSAYSAIALGTLWGGWKIIETLALKITTLHASSGAAANIGASAAIFGATALGMPISTTHAAASSIVGAGLGSRRGAHWRVVGRMVLAWVLTIPFAAGVAWLMFRLTQLPTALAWISVAGVLLAFAAWVGWAMTHTIHASDRRGRDPRRVGAVRPGRRGCRRLRRPCLSRRHPRAARGP